MAKEKVKCGKCGKEVFIDKFKVTTCSSCGNQLRGSKAK